MEKIIYARLVDKEEAKRTRKLGTIGIPTNTELVPAFEATNAFATIGGLSRDNIKILHKLMGGRGSADRIILFIPKKPPIVSNIPFRNINKIRDIVGCNIKESKFSSDTIIEIDAII